MAFTLFCTPFVKPPKVLPAVFNNAEKITGIFDEKKITGYRWNRGAAKKALILHGFSSAACKFHQYVQPLINKGYEVVAFDAPAHGSSEGKTINALVYSNLVIQLSAQYGPFNGFISHSFGGLALCLALENAPPPAGSRVVLIAPATETSTAIDSAFKLFHLCDPRVRTAFESIITKLSGKPVSWFSVNRSIQQIEAEFLWVHDEDDTITPFADALVTRNKNLPNVQFVITQGLGHQQIYKDETIKNKVIDFL